MRHQKHGRKFGRKSGSRHALFSNLVQNLIEHERIKTTDAKAKELRRIAERTISWATSVGSLIGSEKADATDKARVVHAMRMAGRIVKHRPTLEKLFNIVGPRFAGRAGGYTRVMKLGNRHGDAAPVSIIELVDRTEPAAAEPAPSGKKGETKAAGGEGAAKAEKKKTEAKAEKKAAPKAKAEKKAAPKAEKAKGGAKQKDK
jgi:large subunit ribosomal protein L17